MVQEHDQEHLAQFPGYHSQPPKGINILLARHHSVRLTEGKHFLAPSKWLAQGCDRPPWHTSGHTHWMSWLQTKTNTSLHLVHHWVSNQCILEGNLSLGRFLAYFYFPLDPKINKGSIFYLVHLEWSFQSIPNKWTFPSSSYVNKTTSNNHRQ